MFWRALYAVVLSLFWFGISGSYIARSRFSCRGLCREVDFQVVEQHVNPKRCGVPACVVVELLFHSFVFPATVTKYLSLSDVKTVLYRKVLCVEIHEFHLPTAGFCERMSFTDRLWCIHLCFWVLECALFHEKYLFLLSFLNILQ